MSPLVLLSHSYQVYHIWIQLENWEVAKADSIAHSRDALLRIKNFTSNLPLNPHFWSFDTIFEACFESRFTKGKSHFSLYTLTVQISSVHCVTLTEFVRLTSTWHALRHSQRYLIFLSYFSNCLVSKSPSIRSPSSKWTKVVKYQWS